MGPAIQIVWTDYLQYRARLRGFDLGDIEQIVRYSSERYLDTVTGRYIAVGHAGSVLVMIPYEVREGVVIPITIHATTRRQIKARLRSGRFVVYG